LSGGLWNWSGLVDPAWNETGRSACKLFVVPHLVDASSRCRQLLILIQRMGGQAGGHCILNRSGWGGLFRKFRRCELFLFLIILLFSSIVIVAFLKIEGKIRDMS
jgi:hypothetical protein